MAFSGMSTPTASISHDTTLDALRGPFRPTSELVCWGARNGRVVTHAVRSPVRSATRWIRVVSMASARVIARTMVVFRAPASW